MNDLDKQGIAKIKAAAIAKVAALKARQKEQPDEDFVAWVAFPAPVMSAALDAIKDDPEGMLKEIVRGWRNSCEQFPQEEFAVYAEHALAVIEAAEGKPSGDVQG